MAYIFRTNEYKVPYSIASQENETEVVTYILDNTLLRIGFLTIDVLCGAKTLVQIWFNEYGHGTFDYMDRHSVIPFSCRVDWSLGNIRIWWRGGRVPDHEIVASYEYEILTATDGYIPKESVNWIKEGF